MSANTKGPQLPSRRVLMGAALAAAAVASVPAVGRAAEPDPILAAIEAHKSAVALLRAANDLHSKLDRELPIEKCHSRITAWEEIIVATDDPRWIDAQRTLMRCYDAETDAACGLVSERPTTIAGFLALLQYAIAHDVDGDEWPPELQSDGKTRSWHFFLMESLAETLPGLVTEGQI
jgi:hypothetical protein